MKGIVVDCRTGKVEVVDDGKPFPVYPPRPEPTVIDLSEMVELIEYAKKQGWIKKKVTR